MNSERTQTINVINSNSKKPLTKKIIVLHYPKLVVGRHHLMTMKIVLEYDDQHKSPQKRNK